LLKRQAKIALDKASKSFGFMKQISTLEDKVSGLVARVMHLEECDSFFVDFVELACEQLSVSPLHIISTFLLLYLSSFL
jgi:hypothetical protein